MSKKSDPRTIITPYAFKVAPELLGIPLATPFQRLVALLIDLMLIALLTNTGGLPLGIALAIFFIWGSTRKSSRAALGKIFRVVLGCFGFMVLSITILVVWTAGFLEEQGVEVADVTSAAGITESGEDAGGGVAALIGGILGLAELEGVDTREEAEETATVIARTAAGSGSFTTDEIREILSDALPDDRPWSDEKDEIIDLAIAAVEPEASAATQEEGEPEQGEEDEAARRTMELAAATETVAGLPPEEVAAEYAGRLRSGDTLNGNALRLEALRARLSQEVAQDTLSALGETIEDLERDNRVVRDRLENAEEALTQAEESSGFFGFLQNLLDDTFLAFGWGTIYLTVFFTVLNGQTPGKKAMGIRIVLIDNRPMTWWLSFERVGGYAAGLATGLLGFAQIFWDPNRQAIHDKVSETVVIKDGAEPVPGPWMSGVVEDPSGARSVAPGVSQPETRRSTPAGPDPSPGEAGTSADPNSET